jgi:general secretion pathway protein D
MRTTELQLVCTLALAANLMLAQPAQTPPAGAPAPAPAAQTKPAPAPAAPAPTPAAPAPTPAAPAPTPAAPAQTQPAQTQPVQTPPVLTQPVQTQPAVPQPAAAPAAPAVNVPGSLNLTNASLLEVIDLLARDLHLNYIMDPRVKGSVTINTYGEIKAMDLRPLLETILRMNGFQMVEVGNMYRIVPVAEAGRLPISPVANATNLPDDERMVLNLVFLKYVTSTEMAKLLDPFNGEGAKVMDYPPANLLLILDNSRSMKRTLDLIAMFDSDTLAGQRVHPYTVNNGRPSDIAKELDTIFRAYAMSDKTASVKFIPVDRINTVIAVAPNPGTFARVEEWITKLDIQTKRAAGSVEIHVYRMKYGRVEIVGPAIAEVYGTSSGGNMGNYGQTQYGNLANTGVSTGGQFGSGSISLPGSGSAGSGNYGGMTTGGGSTGAVSTSASTTGATTANTGTSSGMGTTGTMGNPMTGGASDLTGSYLSAGMGTGMGRLPRIVPNPYDNTLLIQATPEQWAQLQQLLSELDVPPRQVLIEAKIFEISLTGDLQYGLTAYLQNKNNPISSAPSGAQLVGTTSSTGISFSAGLLSTQSRQLLAAVTGADVSGKTKLIASPSIVATDSIPASINVGTEVPTLQSQAVTGATVSGSSLFANTISTRDTGLTLGIVARINASGVVTMVINEQYSQPEYPSAGAAIQSPSFSDRTVSTQVTVQDGDCIAIGGMVQEDSGVTSSGVPFFDRLPLIGGIFGTKHYTHDRTELIVFLTPHVIYDTNQLQDATEELKQQMTHLKRDIRNQ